jgi:hypothetical protein
MKSAFIRLMATLICLAPCLPLQGQTSAPEPNWDRAAAFQVIRETDTQHILKSLYQLTRSGSEQQLLNSLSTIDQDPGIPGPAKDYLMYKFALGLSDLDAGSVDHQVLDFLSRFEAHTFVPHDEHPAMAIPLFNIRAAASGARNRWSRQKASLLAENLLQESPERWLMSYLAASAVERRGFADALKFASAGQLITLGWTALESLQEKPELTLIAARAGMDSGDLELLQQSILQGGGPDLPGMLKAASSKLSSVESIDLLRHSMQFGSESKAALAIAQLAPGQLDEPAVRDMLFDLLADRELGASAALVLSASLEPEIQDRLRQIATEKDGLAAHRARAALTVGVRPVGREDM